jgi:arylsulfatase A-like enzyme
MPVDKPNILWIFSDQHRAAASGCYGDPNIDTPHLDRLAVEGVRFTNAYANTPICAPFRACLYTGQYITTNRVISLHRPLLSPQPVLPEILQANGYHTSHMGKWHLSGGAAPSHFASPFFRPGWDDWLGWENSNDPMATEFARGSHPLPRRTLNGYQTDALTDHTITWLNQQPPDRPWFHVVSIEPPHPPNIAPEPYMALFRDKPLEYRPNFAHDHPERDKFEAVLRGYYAQIKNLDDNIGRILAALEDTGQLDNTIIFYFSDHGDMMGSHGRMHKSRPEQESANIPLIVRYPARIPQGMVSDALISSVDFAPTLLGLLEMPVPESMEGQDLSATLRGKRTDGAEMVLLQYENSFFAETPETKFRAVRAGHWLYTVFFITGPAQLFDLDADPYQLHNLIDSPDHSAVRQQLHDQLAAKLDTLKDDFFARANTWQATHKESS